MTVKGAWLALLICTGLVAGAWLAGGGPAAAAEVDVTFDRAPVHEVLRILAQAEGINLIVDQGVTGEVTISAKGMDAREAIQLVAAVRGLHVEQIGSTLIVSTAPTGLSGQASQTTASRLNFTQRPVREVLQALAERAGWNFIAEASLNQEITAWLEGMEPVEALRLVAGAAGLSYQLVDRVLHVKAAAAPSAERTAIHRLDHVEAPKGKELIEAFFPDVRVEVDPMTRSIVVKGAEPQLAAVAAFVQSLDTPRPQVLVEARILDVEVQALETLGVEWARELEASGTWTPSPFSLDWNPARLEAALRMLESYSQVLASPKISAVDRETARMLIGERVPVVTEFADPDGRIFQEVEYIEVGIALEIKPTIAADDSVMLDIRTEVSSVVDPEADFPTVRTREAKSTVRVHDGNPLIIGGLIQEEERERMEGIPGLSQLPILGPLFSQRTTDNVQKETIIVLVPRIVNADHADVVAREPVPDGQTAARERTTVASDTATQQSVAQRPALNAGSSQSPGMHTPAAQASSVSEETRQMALSLGRSVVPRPKKREPSPLIFSIDMTSLQKSAAEMQLEREQGNLSVISRVYASTGRSSGAWSLGAGLRYYIGGTERSTILSPWVEGGAEYAAPLRDNPLVVYSAGAGLRLNLGEKGLLELYGRHQHPGRKDGLGGLPGRKEKQSLGLRFGWRY